MRPTTHPSRPQMLLSVEKRRSPTAVLPPCDLPIFPSTREILTFSQSAKNSFSPLIAVAEDSDARCRIIVSPGDYPRRINSIMFTLLSSISVKSGNPSWENLRFYPRGAGTQSSTSRRRRTYQRRPQLVAYPTRRRADPPPKLRLVSW